MKLLSINSGDHLSLGVKIDDQWVLDVREALETVPAPGIPVDTTELIRGGAEALERLRLYVERVSEDRTPSYFKQESDISFGACVSEPSKIICIGLNYRKHAEESNAAIPTTPVVFSKFSNTLAGHGEPIPLPVKVSSEVDYEVELAIVIGRKTKEVAVEDALGHVFGYSCANDISARDLQMRTSQWLLGKTCDKFTPLGPYLVTADEIPDPNQLSLQTTVNGEIRQRSNTSDMIFRCDEIISYLSQHMTLLPGDVILTGTPEGVVLGQPADRRVYLREGDAVVIEIEGLGRLSNRMING
ncbi:fumarylacetoacetate hydrolase family protein [Cohnella yongneupensis]|uniref:Fumarylacetoacetate hydrolase family protein n=1 Tax=Cohnella yongneupensis TaxID=425006 RepID=A0ABW0R0H5_9BACL